MRSTEGGVGTRSPASPKPDIIITLLKRKYGSKLSADGVHVEDDSTSRRSSRISTNLRREGAFAPAYRCGVEQPRVSDAKRHGQDDQPHSPNFNGDGVTNPGRERATLQSCLFNFADFSNFAVLAKANGISG